MLVGGATIGCRFEDCVRDLLVSVIPDSNEAGCVVTNLLGVNPRARSGSDRCSAVIHIIEKNITKEVIMEITPKCDTRACIASAMTGASLKFW